MHTDCPWFSSPFAVNSDTYAAGVASVVTAAESVAAVAVVSAGATAVVSAGASTVVVSVSAGVVVVDSLVLLPQDVNDTAAITAAKATNFFIVF